MVHASAEATLRPSALPRTGKLWETFSGCKLTNFGANLSGDSLTYLVGPRWTAAPLKRWEPYAQVLVGGRTLTHEEIDPAEKAQIEAAAAQEGRQLSFPDHYLYARQTEITGFAVFGERGSGCKADLSDRDPCCRRWV